MFHRFATSLFVLSLLGAVFPVEAGFKASHNMTEAQYQSWINSLDKERLHPTYVSVFGTGAGQRFSAIADDSPSKGWVARHNLTSDAYQKEFTKQAADGYRLISISGYTKNGAVHYAALWVKDGFSGGWEARHGQSSKDYQSTFDACVKKGLRPLQVVGYMAGTTHQISSIFVSDKYKTWQARHDLTAEQYQKMFDEWNPKGYRPASLSAYPTASGTRFAIVMVQDNSASVARHGLTGASYQGLFDQLVKGGYHPTHVCGYPGTGEHLFACAFIKGGTSTSNGVSYPLPATGVKVLSLTAFDAAMQKYMKERDFQAGTLAVSRNGQLVLSRGYGYRDRDAKIPISPSVPMRIASVAKPITLAAVRKLVRDGKLKTSTKVVSYLGIKAPKGKTMAAEWSDITVAHLMDHKGGWDRGTAGDPMFRSKAISKALGITGPATPSNVITYMAGQPLQFTPGSKEVYSNFGYCVLGRVIEKASGKTYTDYVQSDIAGPIGASSIGLGRSLPSARNSREPVYLDSEMAENVMQPSSNVKVPLSDGGFHLEAMDAHGGLIASAPDLIRFLQAYWIDGQPRKKGAAGAWTFFGSLPGTFSMVHQRNDGVDIAVLFNERTADASKNEAILSMLNAAADGIKAWPK